MGYYETTLVRMKAILAHMVTTSQGATGHGHLTCRGWIYAELGEPLGWSRQATCRAITALIKDGYIEPAQNVPPSMSSRQEWLCTTAKGRAYYDTVRSEDTRTPPGSATGHHRTATT